MKPKALYHGHRFPAAIISQAVRWYFRFQLSLRDIEELLFERGVIVSYETIRRWCDKFGAAFARRVKAAGRKPGRTWHLDEMFVNLRGEPWLLWRAVDEPGYPAAEAARQGRSEALFPACAAFLSGIVQHRHRPVTQLPGCQGWHPGARQRQARVREGRRPREQPRREQPSADPRTRATHAGISRPEAHSGFPRELRADPPALRPEAASAACFALSQTPRRTLLDVA
ncbi:iS6 family ISRH1-like transposase [Burkholderia pseudomallei]|uniref:IS6 family ISRH1-like transposase n=1 Tax=Burkholderia pseudomallei TaxID=28450 RepID=A0AA40MGJ9_BURPE|nr:iS6 family ISRH1-like transposase [Burkholderia pseudomallei]